MSTPECVTIGNATLYHGDCLDVMPILGRQFDALITDPPYSSGGQYRGDRMGSTMRKYVSHEAVDAAHNVEFSGDQRDGRSWVFWVANWMRLSTRLLRPGGYVLCFTDWRQLPSLTDAFQAGGYLWRGIVPWDKTESSRAPHCGYFRHQAEYVVWGSHGPLSKDNTGPFPGAIRERVIPSQKFHMTGKPLPVMDKLVRVVKPGGAIFDPFMGSGSTGLSALARGCHFVGVEIDKGAFDIACERIAHLTASTAD
jgi:site-specific DNA-methyltransferase (adenine-specific)